MCVKEKKVYIEQLVRRFRGQALDAHYLGYFECFNSQLYFEAHEVLERLWLPLRRETDGNFYKGLIQLAGAFVHVQKGRSKPALSLLRLAQSHLNSYPEVHHCLDLRKVFVVIGDWSREISSASALDNLLSIKAAPKLVLSPG
jgi:hypothetical protein